MLHKVFCVALVFVTDVSVPAIQAEKRVQGLNSSDSSVRAAAVQKLQLQRQEIVAALLKNVKARTQHNLPDGTLIQSVRLLGRFRAVKAVDSLLAIVDYRPYFVDAPVGYTAAYALISIGRPASRKALQRLRTERSPLRRSLLLEVLKHVEGIPTATFLIKSELRRDNPHTVKARLEQALRELRTGNKDITPFFSHYKSETS